MYLAINKVTGSSKSTAVAVGVFRSPARRIIRKKIAHGNTIQKAAPSVINN